MDYKINDISSVEKEIEVKLTYDEVKDDLQKEIKKQLKKIQIPGFRKGNAPYSMIKKMYGNSLEYDAAEQIVQDRFFKLADELNLNYISKPVISALEFEPEQDLSFKVKYEVAPQIEVKSYRNMDIEVPDIKFTEDELKAELDYILKKERKLEDTDVIGEGNDYQVKVEFIKIDGEGNVEKDSQPHQYDIDMANEGLNEDIAAGLRGKKVDDVFSVELPVPKDPANPEEQIKEKYQIKVLKTQKYSTPELTDELAKKLSNDKLHTKEEYLNDLRKKYEAYYAKQLDDITYNKLAETLVQNNEFDVPKSIKDRYIEDVVREEEEHQKKHKHKEYNKEAYKKQVERNAEFDIKWMLLREEIIKKENIQVTDEDLKARAEKESAEINIPVDKLISYYQSHLKQSLVYEKFLTFLKENNNIVKISPEEYYKPKEDSNEQQS